MYVYVITAKDRAGVAHGIKIGYAKNVAARRSILQSGNPFKLSIADVFLCGMYAQKVERAVHLKLREYLLVGEWFNIDVDKAFDAIKAAMLEICVNKDHLRAFKIATALPIDPSKRRRKRVVAPQNVEPEKQFVPARATLEEVLRMRERCGVVR